ncbi:MAG: hypothetical protein AAB250_17675 [Bdellovibrionota bacterium]
MQRYGPFSFEELEVLKALFDQKGIPFENNLGQVDEEQQAEALEKGGWVATYIELDDNMYQVAKPELERMERAIALPDGDVEMVDEYLCLQCDHVSSLPGNCPAHAQPLLEFSDWVKAKRENNEKMTGSFMWIVILVVGSALAFVYLRK